MKIIAAVLMLAAATVKGEGFSYKGIGELRAILTTSAGETIVSVPAQDPKPAKKRCHAKECKPAGPERRKEDAERGKTPMVHTHEGMYVRSLVAKGDGEVDCREFPVEDCFVDGAGFSYDYVRTEEKGLIVWSVQNVQGFALAQPHRFSKAKGNAADEWTFEGKNNPFKAHCAVARLNGWQQMMEERGGDKITISFLENLTKE